MFIKSFNQIDKNDVNIAGGKGASLGEMINAKMNVPKGYVVLVNAFDRFLEETDLNVEIDSVFDKVNARDINSVEKASKAVQDMIYDAIMPEDIVSEIMDSFVKLKTSHVAVRSSATAEDSSIASWAGELESYLYIDKKKIIESVKKCWASLFTPRAIFYRFEKRLHKQKVSVAVVVQKMINAEVSGITFTANPVTNDMNQIVIEAGWGMGEAIVGGEITPDTYVVNKKQFEIIDKNISEQKIMIVKAEKGTKHTKVDPKLINEQKVIDINIKKIAQIAIQIENHYQKPQDIEWAIEDNKIYILQSRPITTI